MPLKKYDFISKCVGTLLKSSLTGIGHRVEAQVS
jgi:hypothetical protein